MLAEQYRSELFDSVLPFWLKNSQDKEYGGYFSCLDRDGSVYLHEFFLTKLSGNWSKDTCSSRS